MPVAADHNLGFERQGSSQAPAACGWARSQDVSVTPSSRGFGQSAEPWGSHVLCVFVSWQEEGLERKEGQVVEARRGDWRSWVTGEAGG